MDCASAAMPEDFTSTPGQLHSEVNADALNIARVQNCPEITNLNTPIGQSQGMGGQGGQDGQDGQDGQNGHGVQGSQKHLIRVMTGSD